MPVCRSTSCAIAAMFLGATLWSFAAVQLDEGLPKTDEIREIVECRRRIATAGLVVGLLVALAAANAMGMTGTREWRARGACFVAAVTFGVQYFVYVLAPKKDWVVLHLETDEEREAWVAGYRKMQVAFHVGALFGIAGAMAAGYAYC
jgi:hypothetical protein